jgi:hypothetical protein
MPHKGQLPPPAQVSIALLPYLADLNSSFTKKTALSLLIFRYELRLPLQDLLSISSELIFLERVSRSDTESAAFDSGL